MKRTNLSTIAKATLIAAAMIVLPGYGAMANDVSDNVISYQRVAGDYESLKAKLNTFMDKVKQAKKSDLNPLFEQAKALKAEIIAAELTSEQREELQDLFNSIMDMCKNIK